MSTTDSTSDLAALVVLVGFVAAVAVILAAKAIPSLHKFLHYGKLSHLDRALKNKALKNNDLGVFIEYLAGITVPKRWFLHFYMIYTVLQWSLFVFLPNSVRAWSKYLFIWVLLTIQANRRLFESLYVTKFGASSRMHFSHYLLGIFFYTGVSLTCWTGLSREADLIHFTWLDTLILTIFLGMSFDQWLNHRHLALLVKYSVPKYGLFSFVSCAHYFDEIVIYFLVALVAWLHSGITTTDYAFAAISAFVFVELYVGALETLEYYKVKFDDYNVSHAVIPYML